MGPGTMCHRYRLSYWSFRGDDDAGPADDGLLALYGALSAAPEPHWNSRAWFLRLLPWAIALPYLANTAGWLLTEVGRQPWIVFGLMRTEDGVSPSVSGRSGADFSLLVFTLLYGALMVADIYPAGQVRPQGSSGGRDDAPALAAAAVRPDRRCIDGSEHGLVYPDLRSCSPAFSSWKALTMAWASCCPSWARTTPTAG